MQAGPQKKPPLLPQVMQYLPFSKDNPSGFKSATPSSEKLHRQLLYPICTKPISDVRVKAATARKKKLAPAVAQLFVAILEELTQKRKLQAAPLRLCDVLPHCDEGLELLGKIDATQQQKVLAAACAGGPNCWSGKQEWCVGCGVKSKPGR